MENRVRGPEGPGTLRGRADECAALDDLVRSIRRSESRSLVIRGEAGIGKTALLAYLLESGSDLSIVRVLGVESEMELAYASLHQLCAPLLGRLGGLPAPQRQALEIVFGLNAGVPPDRFLVGLAVLSLLSEAADEGPLLCVIDDAQWLDQASALTLAFVARRLLADPVGIVFAAREPSEELRRLPELEVTGLVNDDARGLLGSVVPVRLDERVRDRIIAETHGNPLALLELPHGLTATQLAGGFGLPGAEGVPGQIEESFARRLGALSNDARLLLLLAAAEPLGDPLLLSRAAARLGLTVPSINAETDGMLELGASVTFRHPLVRSAVYRTATAEERRAIHLALGEATEQETDPDRRAWHLAAASAGPDERVALELERSAGRAQARGGLAATAAFLERAFKLTEDPAQRAQRALAAAEASLQAGAFDAALGLLAQAEAESLDEVQCARAELLRGHVAFASGLGQDAPPLLLEAAGRLEPFDPSLARETYLTAWGSAIFAGPAGGDALLQICRAVRSLPALRSAARPLDVLLDGLALLTTDGRAAAAATLQGAAKSLTSIPVEDVLRWGWAATGASNAVWDPEATHAIAARQVRLVRDAGALAELPIHLATLGLIKAWMGDFADAALLVEESNSVAAATGSPIAPYTLMRLRSLQGSEAEASRLIAGAIERDAAGGQGLAAAWAQWAAAVLYNGLGRYEEAAAAGVRATSNAFEPWVSMWALYEVVEAAARAGDRELASDALERLEEATRPCETDFARGIEARSRALLSEGETAERLYQEAIDRLERTELRPERARAHLLYGEWLRRERGRIEVREELLTAYEQFTSIGMEGFAERARGELLASGYKVRKSKVEKRDDLTAQERQIAQLARDDVSNQDIAAQLFLSKRTVEWHLRNVFAKLGIRSRYELPNVLPGSDSEPTPA